MVRSQRRATSGCIYSLRHEIYRNSVICSHKWRGRPRPQAERAGSTRGRLLEKTGSPVGNMSRLEAIVGRLPEVVRVDIEAWNDEPTFRVNGKNFIFTNPDATSLSVKLPKEEAAAVVETDRHVEPTGYGLGRHGWISVTIPNRSSERRWQEIEEWIRTSYTLIAPKRLGRIVLAEDGAGAVASRPDGLR